MCQAWARALVQVEAPVDFPGRQRLPVPARRGGGPGIAFLGSSRTHEGFVDQLDQFRRSAFMHGPMFASSVDLMVGRSMQRRLASTRGSSRKKSSPGIGG